MEKYIPGTDSYYKSGEDFEIYKKMIEMANGISLSQICNITDLQPHMVQNWVKRGFIPHPINKRYFSKHLARILLINALRECMYIEDIGMLMTYINGDVDDESDDLISEEELYKMFFNIVVKIDDCSKIETLIDEQISDSRLNHCMKTMAYAYISSLMAKKSQDYFKIIKQDCSNS